jgi:hypothetical protein
MGMNVFCFYKACVDYGYEYSVEEVVEEFEIPSKVAIEYLKIFNSYL